MTEEKNQYKIAKSVPAPSKNRLQETVNAASSQRLQANAGNSAPAPAPSTKRLQADSKSKE